MHGPGAGAAGSELGTGPGLCLQLEVGKEGPHRDRPLATGEHQQQATLGHRGGLRWA